MADRREQILVAIQSLLATISGLTGCYRDRDAFAASEYLPCAILLDGREEKLTDLGGQTGLGGVPAAIFSLQPQIFVQVKPRDNSDNSTVNNVAAPIGPELSAYRVAVIKALTTDINLAALLGSNGQVQYFGCDTDMQTGSTLEGMIKFDFRFSYVLKPSEL